MAIELLNQITCETWIQCLPEELYVELVHAEKSVCAIGVMDDDDTQPIGAACYEQQENGLALRSIYVLPDYRRKGYGRELLGYISDEAMADGCKLMVCFEWDGDMDVASLFPFLKAGGFQMEFFEMPLGVTDPGTVRFTLEEWGAYKKMGGLRKLEELSVREKYALNDWLIEQTGEHLSSYIGPQASGSVAMRGDELYGAVFFSLYEHRVRLDYCWVERTHRQLLLPLLAEALDALEQLTKREGMDRAAFNDLKIEMILSTEQAIQLYTRFLDCDIEQIILCMGELEEEEEDDYV